MDDATASSYRWGEPHAGDVGSRNGMHVTTFSFIPRLGRPPVAVEAGGTRTGTGREHDGASPLVQ